MSRSMPTGLPPDELTETPPLSRKYLVRFALMGLVLSAIFRTAETQAVPFYAASVIALLTMASVFVLPHRLLIYPVLILIATMPDLTQSGEEIEAFGMIMRASVWQLSLLSLSPAIIALAAVGVATLRLFKLNRSNPYNAVFIYFFGVATIVSLWFGYPQESVARAVTDARVPLLFCSGLVLVTSYFRRYPNSLLATCQAFMALAAGTFVLDTANLFFNSPESLASIGYRNLSLDSAKGLILLYVFFAVVRLAERRRILLNLLLIAVGMYVLTAYQTRQLVLTALLGFLLVAPLLGVRRTVRAYVPIVAFLLLAVPVLISLAPDVWEIALLRFRIGQDISSLAEIDLARTGSIINSTLLLWDKRALLTGLGYGSWFTDSYFPMLNLTVSAFDSESLASGRFYRVHELTIYFLFKFGLIGLWIYAAAFIRPLGHMWQERRTVLLNPTYRAVVIVLFGTFPTVFTFMWWTGKGLLFSGAFVAVCVEWARVFTQQAGLARPARVLTERSPAV